MKKRIILNKLGGLAVILLGIASVLPEGDATAAIALIPLGICIFVSNKDMTQY